MNNIFKLIFQVFSSFILGGLLVFGTLFVLFSVVLIVDWIRNYKDI